MLESLYGLFDRFPALATLLAGVLVAFLSLETGFRYGRRRRQQPTSEQEVLVRTMVRSMAGLLTFTLAVTFWIAATHFDGARQYLLNDVNAIRAAYLRADLLPEPYRAEIRELLRKYVDVRLKGIQSGNIEHAISQSEEIQSSLWSLAVVAREKTSNPIFDGYLNQSLNEVIAIHAKRVAIYREFSIPGMVWVALYVITALAMADAGLPETFNLKVSRHSCASALLKAGVHPKVVSERLGHARISTTLDVYSAIEEAQHRDASERLGEMFGIGKK